MTAPLASAIYEGRVRHRRHLPHPHAFEQRLFQLYLDLDELPRLFDGRWLWSLEHANLAQVRRSDYFGDPRVPLAQAVRDRVESETGRRPTGPIRLLTHGRYFGLRMNPVSFYYGFADGGATLEWVLAEITNTPWGERHAYLLPVAAATASPGGLSWDFDKQFHVRPSCPCNDAIAGGCRCRATRCGSTWTCTRRGAATSTPPSRSPADRWTRTRWLHAWRGIPG